MKTIPQNNITPYQLKMPLEISKIIEISDPVYTFCEVMDYIDLNKYLAEINGYIFAEENVDLNHVYIDGTKLVANANKYSWVWKKSSVKSRQGIIGGY